MRIDFIQKIIDKIRGKKEGMPLQVLKEKMESIIKFGGGMPMPQSFKHKTIIEYAQEYNCNTLIETGTYQGDTTEAVKDCFKELHTIELFEKLYTAACLRFKNEDKIKCYQGDSKVVLNEILSKTVKTPPQSKILFWLDAHYSGTGTACAETETPILQELDIILHSNCNCVILIDDAREFGINPDYPSIFKLKRFVKKIKPQAQIEVYNDIIRIVFED